MRPHQIYAAIALLGIIVGIPTAAYIAANRSQPPHATGIGDAADEALAKKQTICWYGYYTALVNVEYWETEAEAKFVLRWSNLRDEWKALRHGIPEHSPTRADLDRLYDERQEIEHDEPILTHHDALRAAQDRVNARIKTGEIK